MFLILKIQENCFFSLYSQKQVFKNRKQKLFPNITLRISFLKKKKKKKKEGFFELCKVNQSDSPFVPFEGI